MSVPFHVRSHYSVLQSFNQIPDIVRRAKELRLKGIALVDRHTLAGVPSFLEKMKKDAPDTIPIVGCEFRVKRDNDFFNLIVIARNYNGWITLINILGHSELNPEEGPFVSFETIKEFRDDILYIVGGHGSLFELEDGHILFDLDLYHQAPTFLYLEDNPIKPKFYQENVEDYLLKETAIKKIVGRPMTYPERDDVIFQRLLLCSRDEVPLAQSEKLIEAHPELTQFFKTDNNFISDEGVDAEILLDYVVRFDVAHKPFLPAYDVEDPDQYLRELCREGWVQKKLGDKVANDPALKQVYVDRIEKELSVFREAGLSSYMLIVRDFIKYARDNNTQVGLRGSAVGCLVSYLTGISDVDPVIPDPTLPHDPARELLFERFYNKARNSPGHVSLPDVDCDFHPSFRENLINFVRNKYGAETVAHIVTYGRMKGKSALKAVFRILDPVDNSFAVCNDITRAMVDEQKVQDILEDERQENPDYNIVTFNREHIKEIQAFASEYPREFDMAERLANVIQTQSKHAAGVIIGDRPLWQFCPLLIDPKTGEFVVGLEMADAERVGAVKYDFLGVAALEKINCIQNMINTGNVEPDLPDNLDEDSIDHE